jgi:hypothetical protein
LYFYSLSIDKEGFKNISGSKTNKLTQLSNKTSMKNVEIQVYQSNYFWFDVKNSTDQMDQMDTINYNFDYEKLSGNIWRIYIDINLIYQSADIMVRTAFQFVDNELNWDDVFVGDMIEPMVNMALQKCYGGFIQLCKSNGIVIPDEIEIKDDMIPSISDGIINQYFNYRKIQDEENEYMINNIGFKCTSGNDTIIMLKSTFLVIDEFLFNNDKFNKLQNRKAFGNVVPLPRYMTLKMNCAKIDEQDVQLSFFDTVMFSECLDCALQMLLGNKASKLRAALKRGGINEEIQTAYFKLGTALFTQLKEMLSSTNSRIINLENQYNWNNLLY